MDEQNFNYKINEEKVYPPLPERPTAPYNIPLLTNELNKERYDEMNDKYKEMHITLKHYTKLEKRWAKANNLLKLGAFSIGVSTSIAACLASSGLILPLEVIAVSATSVLTTSMVVSTSIGAFGAVDLVLAKIISSSFTSRKKKYYHNKVLIVKKYINRAYIFIEKARNDRIITLKELEDFRALLLYLNNELEKATKDDDKEVSNLINDAKAETKKILKQEILQSYKNKFEETLKNNY